MAALSPLQRQFLYDSLNKPKELKLLFRASDHEFKATTFHQKCETLRILWLLFGLSLRRRLLDFRHTPGIKLLIHMLVMRE